jgi:hypothetical protein
LGSKILAGKNSAAAFIGPCVCGRARFLGSAAPVEIIADRVSTVPATRRSGRAVAAKASPWHGQRAKARGAGDGVLWAEGRKVGAASYPAASFQRKLTRNVSAGLPRLQRPMRCHRHVTEAVLTMKQTGQHRKVKMSGRIEAVVAGT